MTEKQGSLAFFAIITVVAFIRYVHLAQRQVMATVELSMHAFS